VVKGETLNFFNVKKLLILMKNLYIFLS